MAYGRGLKNGDRTISILSLFSGGGAPPLRATLRFTSKQSVWDLRIMRFRVCERGGWEIQCGNM